MSLSVIGVSQSSRFLMTIALVVLLTVGCATVAAAQKAQYGDTGCCCKKYPMITDCNEYMLVQHYQQATVPSYIANVQPGDVILTRNADPDAPVRVMLSALGQHYTHAMLVTRKYTTNGSNVIVKGTEVTHNTALTPGDMVYEFVWDPIWEPRWPWDDVSLPSSLLPRIKVNPVYLRRMVPGNCNNDELFDLTGFGIWPTCLTEDKNPNSPYYNPDRTPADCAGYGARPATFWPYDAILLKPHDNKGPSGTNKTYRDLALDAVAWVNSQPTPPPTFPYALDTYSHQQDTLTGSGCESDYGLGAACSGYVFHALNQQGMGLKKHLYTQAKRKTAATALFGSLKGNIKSMCMNKNLLFQFLQQVPGVSSCLSLYCDYVASQLASQFTNCFAGIENSSGKCDCDDGTKSWKQPGIGYVTSPDDLIPGADLGNGTTQLDWATIQSPSYAGGYTYNVSTGKVKCCKKKVENGEVTYYSCTSPFPLYHCTDDGGNGNDPGGGNGQVPSYLCYKPDSDHDGYAPPGAEQFSSPTPCSCSKKGDCNDSDANVNPGFASERSGCLGTPDCDQLCLPPSGPMNPSPEWLWCNGCADGNDNDGDGLVDGADVDCQLPLDDMFWGDPCFLNVKPGIYPWPGLEGYCAAWIPDCWGYADEYGGIANIVSINPCNHNDGTGTGCDKGLPGCSYAYTNGCNDNIDNDCDGFEDDNDPDCQMIDQPVFAARYALEGLHLVPLDSTNSQGGSPGLSEWERGELLALASAESGLLFGGTDFEPRLVHYDRATTNYTDLSGQLMTNWKAGEVTALAYCQGTWLIGGSGAGPRLLRYDGETLVNLSDPLRRVGWRSGEVLDLANFDGVWLIAGRDANADAPRIVAYDGRSFSEFYDLETWDKGFVSSLAASEDLCLVGGYDRGTNAPRLLGYRSNSRSQMIDLTREFSDWKVGMITALSYSEGTWLVGGQDWGYWEYGRPRLLAFDGNRLTDLSLGLSDWRGEEAIRSIEACGGVWIIAGGENLYTYDGTSFSDESSKIGRFRQVDTITTSDELVIVGGQQYGRPPRSVRP